MNRVSVVKIIGLVISMLLSGCTTNITDNNVSGNDIIYIKTLQS